MRIVTVRIQPDKAPAILAVWAEKIIPALAQTQGCRYAGFLQNVRRPDECISLTLWTSTNEALQYEQSGLFTSLVNESRPFFAASSEFQIQLSQDLTLEYVEVPEEPIVKSHPIAFEGASSHATDEEIWVRIVSLKIRAGMREEFQRLYIGKTIPILQGVTGCQHIYLAEHQDDPNTLMSITTWRSRVDAENYEKSGLFDALLESQIHLLSPLYAWKRKEESVSGIGVTTSDDVVADKFEVLISRSFR